MKETSSSEPGRISSSGYGSFRRSGKGLSFFGWIKLHLRFGGGNGASDFSQKAEVPCVPESFQIGASGSPTACNEDFGADEVSQGCSHLRAQSLLSAFNSFEESEAQGTVFVESSTE